MAEASVDESKLKVTLVGAASGSTSAITPRALEVEDEFREFYSGEGTPTGASLSLLAPPYPPTTLERLVQANPSLGPCIDSMETNVDGTGHVIEFEKGDDGEKETDGSVGGADPDKEEAAEHQGHIQRAKSFFEETWPGESFLSLRKKVRRDLENTGNGYMECLSNVKGELVFMRHAPSRNIRLLRLDAPVLAPVKIERNGVEVTMSTYIRERRFAQIVAGKLLYFREFGATRHLNCETGMWETAEAPVPLDKRATEILHFKLNPDAGSPYGVPRWEGQIPSVIGQRRAEEHNLEFFDSGGMPPILLIVGGGIATEETRAALEQKFAPKQGGQHRAAIVEVQSAGGSLDKASGVDIKVERFGADQQKDGMFQSYDVACEKKIRRSFRLSGMFTGDYEGVSFATAYAAVLLAESQVFRPERDEFDNVITRRVLPRLNVKCCVFRSKPMAVVDTATKMAGLQLAMATQRVDLAEVVTNVNEIAALNLTVVAAPEPPPPQTLEVSGDATDEAQNSSPPGNPRLAVAPESSGLQPKPVSKHDTPIGVLGLADEVMIGLRRRDYVGLTKTITAAESLSEGNKAKLRAALAVRQYMDPSIDPEGTSLLAGCTIAAMRTAGEA
ncbi:phage portal family protein [Roseococcus pinisoli]|uniref:Phage portal protein n=1 Tax=Roseococcus pinisoli TaxID=2835040 RepID=A0ABS5QHF2_9PROT|nr:hypothetical protein [Roseococcus pinisoli]MBS7812362.1 hypothetical protein [Roseococcus pinisoli]